MRRWVCPRCGGGNHAPDRPRTDDVRRYCLDCSKATGRLVKRTCPALDRERGEKRERVAAKTVTKRQRDREREVAERTAAGVDLHKEARRLWALPALKERRTRPDGSTRRDFPALEIRRHRQGWKTHSSGHCYYMGRRSRIVVTIGLDGYGAWETLLHELVHVVMGPGEHHSQRFWNYLSAAAAEAWPDVNFRFKDAPPRGYALDNWIGNRLADHYDGKGQ